jgi:pSer/pThr/pTyr-binding forkhead associated (FHA) protein
MRTCPFCNTETEPFLRFCLGCGEDLDRAFAPKAEPAPQPPAAVRAERARQTQGELPAAADDSARAASESAQRTAVPAGVGSPPASRSGVRRPGSAVGVGLRGPDGTTTETPALEAARATAPIPPVPSATGFGSRPGLPPASRRVRRRIASAVLVQVFDDGTEETVVTLGPQPLIIGRSEARYEPSEGPWDPASEVLAYPEDDFMAARHVVMYIDFDSVKIEPLSSTNGLFIQLTEPHVCERRTVFRIGQQLLQLDRLDQLSAHGGPERGVLGSPVPESAWGRLAQIMTPTQFGDVHLLGGEQVRLGRERGDINFGADLFVSGLHAAIRWRERKVVLEDLGSSNGTYLRLDAAVRLVATSSILVGQQLFRVELSHG